MSNIYVQEPPTSGKVLLVTSVGEIDIELWSKEAPKACRNFVQLCMEGYYDGTIFHRVVPEFIVQGGDPEGTGHGGESIYGAPFNDELHSRLRFVRRGLVAMANEEAPHTNGSQFFFTLGASPDLNNKHTIFGRIAGDTVYNMIKLGDTETDRDARPLYPQKIISTEILVNPFDDIVPRKNDRKTKTVEVRKEKQSQMKATKNFKLLSFGEEAEEDEDELVKTIPDAQHIKSKSSHDLLDDKFLSPELAIDPVQDALEDNEKREREAKSVAENIRKKLKKNKKDDADEKRVELRNEEYGKDREAKKSKDPKKLKRSGSKDDDADKPTEYKTADTWKLTKNKKPKNQTDREEQTMAMLAKFKSKLESAVEVEEKIGDSDDDDDAGWMKHTLRCEEHETRAKDANVHEHDRFDVIDPRNPLTQRRREESERAMKGKKSTKDVL